MLNKLIILFITFFICSDSISAEPFINNLTIPNYEKLSFKGPTYRQLEKEKANIQKYLPISKANLKYWNWWNDIIKYEEMGVFGYHASRQQYRIFQDIIKTIFMEILDFEIKSDFYFFRIPLDPDVHEYVSSTEFLQYTPHPFDGNPPDRDQLLSINYTLFGNYANEYNCTVCFFSKHTSAFQIFYAEKLKFLFNELGMPTNEIEQLFALGNAFLNFDSGVIYQFTDLSHQSSIYHSLYEIVDKMAYPSYYAGTFDSTVQTTFSNLFLETQPKKFDNGTGQIRLIMNTAITLNPYSSISIRRFDLLDPKIVKNYEEKLRDKIKKMKRNNLQVENYKKKVMSSWGL